MTNRTGRRVRRFVAAALLALAVFLPARAAPAEPPPEYLAALSEKYGLEPPPPRMDGVLAALLRGDGDVGFSAVPGEPPDPAQAEALKRLLPAAVLVGTIALTVVTYLGQDAG